MPKVSVIIPAYNHGAFIAEALESVLAQTEPDFELLIIDDGSTDNTLEVISSFSDERMTLFTQSNHGAHAAINRGLDAASGKYLAILNSDDSYHPQRLEIAISMLESNPGTGFVGSYIQIIDSNSKSLGIKHGYKDCEPWLLPFPELSFRAGSDLRAVLLTENYWSTTSNFIFTRECYHQAGGFRPLRYTHDWDFALRMAKITNMKLIPDPLVRYRVHETNTIRENQAAMIFEICWILAVHLPQHIHQQQFLQGSTPQNRNEQLLYSIHTFGMDRVLSVMLAHQLHENPALALSLLNQDDPLRATYMEYILANLSQVEEDEPKINHQNKLHAQGENVLARGLRKAKSILK